MDRVKILVSEQVLQVPFCYSAGKVVSRFLLGLAEECTIYGIRCPACARVYVPPRATCGRCFVENTEWVPLSGAGVIETFTEVNYTETVHPLPAPFWIGVIRLDGADTGMVHLLRTGEGLEPGIGRRVKAVFARKRSGRILDISHFEPISSK